MVRILPSEAFTTMFRECKPHITKLRKDFAAVGVPMPIADPVCISAQFYRKQNSGDWNGFTQALGDILEWHSSIKPDCLNCECPAVAHKGGHCPTGRAGGYKRPPGAKDNKVYKGLIQNDVLIRHWDGTRLHVDHKHPRIEVCLEILPPDDGDQLALVPDEPDEQEIDAPETSDSEA